MYFKLKVVLDASPPPPISTTQKQFRDDPKAYRRKVRDLVARSLEA